MSASTLTWAAAISRPPAGVVVCQVRPCRVREASVDLSRAAPRQGFVWPQLAACAPVPLEMAREHEGVLDLLHEEALVPAGGKAALT